MSTNQREIMIFDNPESNSDCQTVAHPRGMSPHTKSYAHSNSPSTKIRTLLSKAHPYYQKNIRDREFDRQDWIMVISNNPDLIKSPITVRGRNAVICNSPTDIYKLTAPNL